nr:MAG TPA: hypothetical protein [Caudoviricetes sp.]
MTCSFNEIICCNKSISYIINITYSVSTSSR